MGYSIVIVSEPVGIEIFTLIGTFCNLYDLTSPFYITKHLRNRKNRKVKIILHVLAFYKRMSSFNLLGT